VRWRYAAGVGGYGSGWARFAHTVLVDMRARLRGSTRPDRIFEVGLEAAAAAGLVGRRRVLDSTPLYDAVATMDTVTLIRSAVRGLLAVADPELAAALRAGLSSGDDYAGNGKPQIDWDDRAAREELIDSRARDGFAVLALLDGRRLADPVGQAAALLATVLGQDLEEGPDNVFRIARRVARDRVISTVDPDTRHGHKTSARGFDGYKAHTAVDPDSEIITATTVTPGNAGDASVAEDLIADLLGDQPGQPEPKPAGPEVAGPEVAGPEVAESSAVEDAEQAAVYGDNAYGTGSFHDRLGQAGIEDRCKTQAPTAAGGLFSKDRFGIDLDAGAVTCPGGITARSARPAPVAAPPTSGRPAPSARCAPDAPPPLAGARSASARTSRPSPTPAPARPTPPGSLPTAAPAPRSSASSATSCAAATAGAEPGSAARPASPPTSGCWPPRSTSHAWPSSTCADPPQDGRWPSEQHKHAQPDKSADRRTRTPPPQQPQRLAWNLVPPRPRPSQEPP
jgi:hypothetical protein